MLMKQPGFTLIAVVTLALGIGATSTIFSFANGILLRPLPYREPERLVLVDETSPRALGANNIAFPNFLDWRARNQSFTGIAVYDGGSFTLTGGGEPQRLEGGEISYDTFEVLGVAPLVGRSFRAEEDQPGADAVVILGHGLWAQRFGAQSAILGQTINLNNRARTVIGVMPPGFRFPDNADLWVPLALDVKRSPRSSHGLGGVARLKPGVTLAQAQADMNAVARGIEKENPATNENAGVSVEELRAGLTGDYQTALALLFGIVGMVLAVACANVANLLLARASTRQRELAVRAALGASRIRLFRQWLTESLLLGALGGAGGLLLARWGLDLVLAAIPIEFPFWMRFNLDGRVVGFTVGVSLLTSLVFGAAPALLASRIELNETLKEGGRNNASATRHGLRGALVVVEVALSLVLLIGAGLMMLSFLRLQSVHPGFNPEGVLTAQVGISDVRYDTPEKRRLFFQQLRDRVAALPGVAAVGAASHLPLSESFWGSSLTVEGFPVLSSAQAPRIFRTVITPQYLNALDIPLRAGRDFTDADTPDTPLVTIIDEGLAREYWPGESALGKRIRFGAPEANQPWHTIVGVVGEVKQERLDRSRRRSVYLAHGQRAFDGMRLTIRATANPPDLSAALRRTVKALDPDVPLDEVRTLASHVARSYWQPRLYALLFGLFAGVGLLLACVGIYGVMSYAVAQRTHEIGIRMALGAQARDVLRLIVAQGMKLALFGVALGLLAAWGLTRWLKTLLFGVNATDPLTFGAVAALLCASALLACWIPARRATKVDPMIALRCE
jgi:putative ABC transport system permease protein